LPRVVESGNCEECVKIRVAPGKGLSMVDGFFGGLEFGFIAGWLITVTIRYFVYRQPLFTLY
jgi:hypothetical protein